MHFEIQSWSELAIKGRIIFENPMGVSKGDFRDDLKIVIRNYTLFTSAKDSSIQL